MGKHHLSHGLTRFGFVLVFIFSNFITTQAQSLTFENLVALNSLNDVDDVDEYMSKLGWQFDKAAPESKIAQVVWLHKFPDDSGENDATLNVLFCNSCENAFCNKCADSNGNHGKRHVTSVIYRMANKVDFSHIKKAAEYNKMVSSTTLYERSIRTVYVGKNYELDMSTYTYSDGHQPDYLITLSRRVK